MLENELKNCMTQWVDEPTRQIEIRKQKLERLKQFASRLSKIPIEDDELPVQVRHLAKYYEALLARKLPQMTKQQEQLLNQLIYFDTLMGEEEDMERIKHKLYDLFFLWKKENQEDEALETV